MWPNPQFPADFVTFNEEILNGNFIFCAAPQSFKSSEVSPFSSFISRIFRFKSLISYNFFEQFRFFLHILDFVSGGYLLDVSLVNCNMFICTSSAYEKFEYGHMGSWYIKSTLCKRFFRWNKIFKKIK